MSSCRQPPITTDHMTSVQRRTKVTEPAWYRGRYSTSNFISEYLFPLLFPRHLVFPPSRSWHQKPFLGSNLYRVGHNFIVKSNIPKELFSIKLELLSGCKSEPLMNIYRHAKVQKWLSVDGMFILFFIIFLVLFLALNYKYEMSPVLQAFIPRHSNLKQASKKSHISVL